MEDKHTFTVRIEDTANGVSSAVQEVLENNGCACIGNAVDCCRRALLAMGYSEGAVNDYIEAQ